MPARKQRKIEDGLLPPSLPAGEREFARPEIEDLFTSPKLSDPVAFTREITVFPMSALENQGPLTWVIPRVEDEFTDLTQSRLKLVVKVERGNGDKLEKWREDGLKPLSKDGSSEPNHPEISIPCDFFDALIKRLTVEINGVAIGGQNAHHPQSAFLKNLLSVSSDYADRVLKNSLVWIKVSGIEEMVLV